jgi:hypothetical protein
LKDATHSSRRVLHTGMHELARHSLRDVGHGDRRIDRIGEPELVILAFFLRRGEPLLGHEQLRPLFENEGWTEGEQKKTIHEESKDEPWPRVACLQLRRKVAGDLVLHADVRHHPLDLLRRLVELDLETNHLLGLSGRAIPDRRSKQRAS